MDFNQTGGVIAVQAQGVDCGQIVRVGKWWVYQPIDGLHLTAGQLGAISKRLVQENSKRGE